MPPLADSHSSRAWSARRRASPSATPDATDVSQSVVHNSAQSVSDGCCRGSAPSLDGSAHAPARTLKTTRGPKRRTNIEEHHQSGGPRSGTLTISTIPGSPTSRWDRCCLNGRHVIRLRSSRVSRRLASPARSPEREICDPPHEKGHVASVDRRRTKGSAVREFTVVGRCRRMAARSPPLPQGRTPAGPHGRRALQQQ